MLIYGAGSHGKVVYGCIKANGQSVQLFFDDDLGHNIPWDIPVKAYHADLYPKQPLIIAIGNNKARERLSRGRVRHSFGNAIHPSCLVATEVVLGKGCMLIHSSVIQTGTKIGDHCIVNTAASVDHDCIIENFVHVAPHATLCGEVKVGEGSLIGAGATVIPGIRIGKWTTVGAGAVVLEDVPDFSLVVGNPARVVKTS